MLAVFLWLASFATPEEVATAKKHYSGTQIENRIYVRNPLGIRFYIDTTKTRDATLSAFHFETYVYGMGYEQEIYWGNIKGRPCFFAVDHEDHNFDRPEVEIRR